MVAEIRHLLHPAKTAVTDAMYRMATRVSPELNTQLRFRQATGSFADLKEPRTFSEKLSWLKLHDFSESELVRQCADKLTVREYVKGAGYGHMLSELVGIYRDENEVPWADLPNAFALKWSFGSGLNLVCEDKAHFDIEAAKAKLKKMSRSKYWLDYSELQYKSPAPRLFCEKFLGEPGGDPLVDYKYYCFHGKPVAVLAIARRDQQPECAAFMSLDWEYISDIPSRYEATFHPARPQDLEEMTRAAERLSAPFPFARVDLYDLESGPVFGEITFTPAAGICPSETVVDGRTMGELLHIDVTGSR